MIKDTQLIKNYNKIQKKIEKLIKIDFNTKTIYGKGDDKYIKTKIRTYKDNVTTKNLKKYQKKKYHINVYQLDSVLYAYKKYHPQIFLEECKYAKENIKTKNYIDNELKSESDSDNDIDIDSEE